jgi:hypothetical protein
MGGGGSGTAAPLNREEFDRLLTKARRSGPSTLSVQERAFMERFTPE